MREVDLAGRLADHNPDQWAETSAFGKRRLPRRTHLDQAGEGGARAAVAVDQDADGGLGCITC